MTSGPPVEAHHLEAAYGPGPPALSRVEFAVESGRLAAVLGPNGGGKTTLFRTLLGEVPIVSGTVALRERVAYVPQTERSRLDFPIDALGVAAMGTYASLPWYRRLGSAQLSLARQALRRVGITDDVAERPYGELSGGQRQRVLIARALAQQARILLLDEPLSGADSPSAARILELLGELRDDGHTILIATHNLEQAAACDLVLCLNREQIAFGPPETTLSPSVLARTYGAEMVELPDGEHAIVVHHHAH
jgi:manganese/iron transport system ATP-binding protein/manganese/zinc/iron transport system ATP- binding protein